MRQRNLSTALSIETGMNTAAVTNACYWTEVARTKGAGSNRLQGDLEADVAIIGAGIVGTIAARLLKDRGRKVALIEAGRAGYGVTGRSTAKVTAQHSTYLQRIEHDHGAQAASIYADANRAGVKLIGELVRQHRVSCDLEPADSWVYAQTEDGARKLKDEFAAAERAGLPMELVKIESAILGSALRFAFVTSFNSNPSTSSPSLRPQLPAMAHSCSSTAA